MKLAESTCTYCGATRKVTREFVYRHAWSEVEHTDRLCIRCQGEVNILREVNR